MSADTDRFDARLASVETAVEQMDARLGETNARIDRLDERMAGRFDTLDEKIDGVSNSLDDKIDREIQNLRTDFRRWLFALFAGLSLVFTVVSIVVQLAL